MLQIKNIQNVGQANVDRFQVIKPQKVHLSPPQILFESACS
jgi:hypothetical protein